MNPETSNGRFDPDTLDHLRDQDTVLLTTYKRDGTPIGTPVHLVIADGRPYFRTYNAAWKARRLRRNHDVEIAPSTLRGEPTGPALHALAHLAEGDEANRAARALARRHPIFQRWLIPWYHRLRGWKTIYFRVEPVRDCGT